MKFEEALARLEQVVKELERGDLPLEESIVKFEEGIGLTKTCLSILEEAGRKVQILVADRDGKKRERPFTGTEGE